MLFSRLPALSSIKIGGLTSDSLLRRFLNPLDRYDTTFLVHTLKELYLPRLEEQFPSKVVLDILSKYRQLRVFEFGGDILKVTEVLDQWSEYASHVTHLIVRDHCT